MKKRGEIWPWHIGLTLFTVSVLLFPMGNGSFFGSEGDWYSQHVGAAEMLRQTMLEQHTLFPQFTTVGGGTNIYDFAYYGLFRPDVMLSCLTPDLEMKYVIAGYALLSAVTAVNLCFWWFSRKKGLSFVASGIGAAFMALASCFFHAHHQIMFINYMPFLILALAGVDRLIEKRKSLLLVFGLTFLCLHSFYYGPVSLVACFIYYVSRQMDGGMEGIKDRKCHGKAMIAAATGIGLAAVLLIPSALAILSTQKDGGSFGTESFSLVDFSLSGLLYQPYGCGLTLIALYCLFLSLGSKRRRFLAAVLLTVLMIPVIWLVLNGFLYAREKILIPFLPLILLVCVDTLEELYQGKRKFLWVPALLCLVPAIFSSWWPAVLADGAILLLWIGLERSKKFSAILKRRAFSLLLLVPLGISIGVHSSENYLPASDQRQSRFSQEELTDFAEDSLYRFDVLANPLENANIIAGGIQKTSMYSSVSNGVYSRFYYDTIGNSIRIQNRVALLPAANPAFQYFMGIKYILTSEDKVPKGYRIVFSKDGYVLAENEDVLPIAYGTYDTLSVSAYRQLSFPENIEALCSSAVVPNGGEKKFPSHIQEADLTFPLTEKLEKPLADQILFIRFGVESPRGQAVIVSINGMINKLSPKSAPYPNRNYQFTYVLDTGSYLDRLEIEASDGDYQLSQLESYTLDKRWLGLEPDNVEIPEIDGNARRNGERVFDGKITMERDGWFITSYPYQEGYRILVDGEEQEAQKVNTAFLGFPLSAGEHQIEICFRAPGFMAGLTISGLSLLFVLFLFWKERKNEK